MTRARRDENDDRQDELVEVEEDAAADRQSDEQSEVGRDAGVKPRTPVDPEAAVQLRWVYSPGETRLQYRQGSDPWQTVPHFRLEEIEASEAKDK